MCGGGVAYEGEFDESQVKINQKNPQARDGHISVLYEGKMFIFGGDRHHMPFNDLFMLDVEDFFYTDTMQNDNEVVVRDYLN